jgi:hypothetical protein
MKEGEEYVRKIRDGFYRDMRIAVDGLDAGFHGNLCSILWFNQINYKFS